MSSSTSSQTPQLPHGPSWLLPVQWILTGVALLLTVGRYVLRWRSNHRLLSDDWSHGFAMVMLIVFMAIMTALVPLSVKLTLYVNGIGPKMSDAELMRYFRLFVAFADSVWTVLYTVKLTFLILYRRLFGISPGFRKAWWAVLIYTALSYVASFMTSFWACGTPSKFLVIEACLSKKGQLAIKRYAPAMVALNISSDIAIVALPLSMLHKLHMKRRQKISLGVIFFLAVLAIFFDIARMTVTGGGQVLKLPIVWDIMEPLTAVIISSLIPYSALLISNDRNSKRIASTPNHNLTVIPSLSDAPTLTSEVSSINGADARYQKGPKHVSTSQLSTDEE